MFPWARIKADGVSPSENFITTYQRDYKPMDDLRKTRTEAKPAPGFTSSFQAKCETWPVFVQHFYRTVNSSYGSGVGPQHPPGSPFPTFLPSFGSSTPSFSEAVGGVGCTPKEAAAQEARAAKETGLSFGASNAENVLKQHESKDGVRYQEGVILLSPYAGTISCEHFLRVLGGEAGPQSLLSLPGGSSPFITPSWSPVVDLQFSCCGRKPERPDGGCCPEKQVVPLSRKYHYRTEYGDKFTAEWTQPRSQQIYFPPCHRNLRPSG